MIETFFAFIYISFVCWSFGSGLLHILQKGFINEPPPSQPFIITCFLGLAVIGVLFTALSLFMPIDNIASQLLLLLPSLYWCYKKKLYPGFVLKKLKERSAGYSPLLLAALFSSILLVFIMHAHLINHPDTIAYHAQNIQWIEKYHAIPGIANLYLNYGIQSSWFVLSALFSFSFTGTASLTFINAVVLTWFILFACRQIQRSLNGNNSLIAATGWLLLLAFSFWSYTQVRLTASSASPDFIATLYVWLIIYLFISRPAGQSPACILLLLACFALTIKLSALPCILFGLYGRYRQVKISPAKKIIYPALLMFTVLVPSLARNVISSGYLVFPSSFPDFFAVDWKVPSQTLSLTREYITAYARTNVNYNSSDIDAVMKMNLNEWLPIWWQLRSLADKIILIGCPAILVLSLFFIKKIFSRENKNPVIALLFSFAGLLFWFGQAPDPRFGFGFIIPFIGLLIYLLPLGNKLSFIKKQWLLLGLGMFSAAMLSYTAYRCIHFFNAQDILAPAGVMATPYTTSAYDGVKINIPAVNWDCGNVPVPCTTAPCSQFALRGKAVTDGFKAK